jgi:hypothetical protein
MTNQYEMYKKYFERTESNEAKREYFKRMENEKDYECRSMGKMFVPGYVKQDGTFVHGYCRDMTSEERRNEEERPRSIRETMSKYPSKPKIKAIYPLGGDLYVFTYESSNPFEDAVGGKVEHKKLSPDYFKKHPQMKKYVRH